MKRSKTCNENVVIVCDVCSDHVLAKFARGANGDAVSVDRQYWYQEGRTAEGKNMLRKLLWQGVGIVVFIMIGWFLREIHIGDWADDYYEIREIQKDRGDYSYLYEF